MNPVFQFRNQVEAAPGGSWVARALSSVINTIAASWQIEHTSDGGHGVITLGTRTGPSLRAGAQSPEGVITAPIGSVYLRTNGGAGTTLYIKESGVASTGWVAK